MYCDFKYLRQKLCLELEIKIFQGYGTKLSAQSKYTLILPTAFSITAVCTTASSYGSESYNIIWLIFIKLFDTSDTQMLTKRIYLLTFILNIISFYFCIIENIFNYTSTLKSRKPEDVRRSEDQSNTEFQVVSQNKKTYTEECV